MMPLEPVDLGFGAVLLLGLGYGSGPCNIACLPYLGPVFVATGNGIRHAWRILLPFSLGRITGYTLLGGGAGWAGLLVQDWIAAPWVRWVLGGATLLVALSLLQRRRVTSICTKARPHRPTTVTFAVSPPSAAPALPGSLFLMGMGMALNPCAPLTMVILAAATAASASAGALLGIGFGLGAVAVPTLIFAFGIAHFGRQLQEHLARWRRPLENTSIALLFLMATGTALGVIVP